MVLGKLYFSYHLVGIVRKPLTWIKLQVETTHENFIVGGDPSCNRPKAGGHLFGFNRSQIVVNEYNKRERESLGSENINRLFNLVVEDAKLMLLKVGN